MPYDPRACNGPCNKAYREAVDAYDRDSAIHEQEAAAYPGILAAWHPPLLHPAEPMPPTKPATRYRDGDPVWSPGCAKLIRTALTNLDDLASLAQAGVDGHRGAGARHGKTGAVSKVDAPSPSPVTDTLDELYGALVDVEDNWREYRHHPQRPQRARGGNARRLAISYLLDELDAILLHPGSVAFGHAALAWHRRLTTLTRSNPASKRSPVRCPRCKEVGRIKLEDDGNYYKCGSCERLMSQPEHDREIAEQADQLDNQEAHAS